MCGWLRAQVLLHDNDPEDVSRILQGYGLETSIILTRAADEEKLHIMKVVWSSTNRHTSNDPNPTPL